MCPQGKPLIIHVVISLDTGGLERFVIDLIRASSNNYDFILISLERPGTLAALCEDIKIVSLEMKPGFHAQSILELSKIIRMYNGVLVHTHNEKAQLYGSLAGKMAGVPVVHTKHGKNEVDFRTCLRNKVASLFCNEIVAVSDDAAEQCVKDEKICRNKVRTILNGIDTDRFSPESSCRRIRDEFKIPPDMPVVGTVARLAPVKDQATLLEACAILKQNGINFKLLLVGDGQLRGKLEEQTSAYCLNDLVVFTGMRNDIPDVMCAMDIFALSSLSEGISLTLLEAMACSLPIVATAVGGNPEVVVDGETGYLVKVASPAILADKLKHLISDKKLRELMGTAGRERVLSCFSLKKCALEYMQLYSSLIGCP